jgi:hypothetical protein
MSANDPKRTFMPNPRGAHVGFPGHKTAFGGMEKAQK